MEKVCIPDTSPCLVIVIAKTYRIFQLCLIKVQHWMYVFNKPKYRILKSGILECSNWNTSTDLGFMPTIRRGSVNLNNGVIVLYMKYDYRNDMAVGEMKKKWTWTQHFRWQAFENNNTPTTLNWHHRFGCFSSFNNTPKTVWKNMIISCHSTWY